MHYKWRAMRANGIDEQFCTGDADPFDKFMAWAKTVPNTLRNPLYHWTHLELQRYFGIDDLLNERSAPGIWEAANDQLKSPEMTTHGILAKFKVRALCTTDDPADDLAHHRAIAQSGLVTRVYPAFRPDKALAIDNLEVLGPWLKRLEASSGVSIGSLANLPHDALDPGDTTIFHDAGCRLSDARHVHDATPTFPTKRPGGAFSSIWR